jgi:transglutaminase-like putative cysteine protease
VIYRVAHLTEYAYAQPVSVCHNLLHLRPRERSVQRCLTSDLAIRPKPVVLHDRLDVFANRTTDFTIEELHRELVIEATSEVELDAVPPPDPASDCAWEDAQRVLRAKRDPDALERYRLCFDSPLVAASEALRGFAEPSFPAGRPLLEATADLCSRIHREFVYEPGATTVATSPDELLELRRGVCQDFAHVAIGCLRSLGLAARYVSGYLVTGRVRDAGSTELVGADASHAWLAVWSPALGWVDLDPTNDLLPSDRHITVAWGRDYGDVSPIRGVVMGGGQHTVNVSVEVVAA